MPSFVEDAAVEVAVDDRRCCGSSSAVVVRMSPAICCDGFTSVPCCLSGIVLDVLLISFLELRKAWDSHGKKCRIVVVLRSE